MLSPRGSLMLTPMLFLLMSSRQPDLPGPRLRPEGLRTRVTRLTACPGWIQRHVWIVKQEPHMHMMYPLCKDSQYAGMAARRLHLERVESQNFLQVTNSPECTQMCIKHVLQKMWHIRDAWWSDVARHCFRAHALFLRHRAQAIVTLNVRHKECTTCQLHFSFFFSCRWGLKATRRDLQISKQPRCLVTYKQQNI